MRAALLSLCFASTAFADGFEGTWIGTLEGKPFTLELKSGGKANFLGQAGRWKASGGGVVVTDAEGTTYRGAMQSSSLVFRLDDGPLVLTRTAKSKPLPALKPKKPLPGKRVTPEGTELSVTVPKGFTSAWGELDGAEVFVISPSSGDAVGPAVYASARQLSDEEAQASAAQLLAAWAPARLHSHLCDAVPWKSEQCPEIRKGHRVGPPVCPLPREQRDYTLLDAPFSAASLHKNLS